MDKDMENPWLGVETGCAEAGESRGSRKRFPALLTAHGKAERGRENAGFREKTQDGVAVFLLGLHCPQKCFCGAHIGVAEKEGRNVDLRGVKEKV